MVCLPGHATFPVIINTDYSTTPNLDHTKKNGGFLRTHTATSTDELLNWARGYPCNLR
jgi:hypothetical protein